MAPPNRWTLTKHSLETSGPLEAPLNHVSMRRFSEGLLERTEEVRRASLPYSTESLSGNIMRIAEFSKHEAD
jgi:hypothetical protein